MKLDYIKEFLQVAERQNLTAVSKDFFLSQSALSRHISILEEELGYPLLNRDSHHFSLTPQGDIAIKYFRKIINEYSKMTDELAASVLGSVGSLRIGMLYYVIDKYYMPVLLPYQKKHPNIKLHFVSCQPYQIIDGLRNHLIDIGVVDFLDEENGTEFLFQKINEVGYIAVFPESHPLADRKSVRLDDLSNETLIFLTTDYWSTHVSTTAMKHCGFIPANSVYTDNIDTVPMLLVNQNAVMLMPSTLKDIFSQFSSVPIEDAALRSNIGYVYRKDDDNPAIQLMLQELPNAFGHLIE